MLEVEHIFEFKRMIMNSLNVPLARPHARYRHHSLRGTCGIPTKSQSILVEVELDPPQDGLDSGSLPTPIAITLPNSQRIPVVSAYSTYTYGRALFGNLIIMWDVCIKANRRERHLFWEQSSDTWFIASSEQFSLTVDEWRM